MEVHLKKKRGSIRLNEEKWLRNTQDVLKWRVKNIPEDELCPILKFTPKTWTVDHDHVSGYTRGVISSEANCHLDGRITKIYEKYLAHKTNLSLPEVLRNLADYLEMPYWLENPLHHRYVADQRKFLERCTIPKIIERAKLDLGIDLVHNADKETLIVSYLKEFIKQREEIDETSYY